MRESLRHTVAAAEDDVICKRIRTLTLNVPKPVPVTVTEAAAVVMVAYALALVALTRGTIRYSAMNIAGELVSTVTANPCTLPSDRDREHVNEESLVQRVTEQAVVPARPRGFELAFAKYWPNSCTLVLPLAL
jgi:hypothetical protein